MQTFTGHPHLNSHREEKRYTVCDTQRHTHAQEVVFDSSMKSGNLLKYFVYRQVHFFKTVSTDCSIVGILPFSPLILPVAALLCI